MTAAAESASKGSSGSYIGQPATSKLLEAGQYKQLTELLTKAQEASRQKHDVATAEILTAALQLCLTGSQYQAEMAWHQQAYEEAHHRGEAIKGQIAALLDLVSDLEAREERPPAELKLPQPERPKSGGERPSRWQRLQSLLGWRPDPQYPEREAFDLAPPSAAEKTKVASPPEKIETPLSPPAEQDKLLPTPPKIDVAGTASAIEAEVTATPSIESNLPKPDTSASVEHFSLWQRIQNLLGRGPSSRKAEQKVSTRSAETLVTSSLSPSAANPVADKSQQEQGPPTLTVHCLGPFRVYQDNQLIENWPNGKGKSIFKYLVAHRERPIAKEILMDLFWPDANPDAARNRLNVAVHGLRKTLHKIHAEFPHILFQDDCYLLNPELQIWVDVEGLVEHFEAAQKLEQRGELASSIREYSAAEALYQGEFLEEDRYEDWLIPRREGLRDTYLVILDRLSRYALEENKYTTCIHFCLKILAEDNCREDAHRRLMRCYNRQGQCHLALRQYHLCEEALARVLDVPPTPETVALYHQIRRREAV